MNTGFDILEVSENAVEISFLEKAVFGADCEFQSAGSEGYIKGGVEHDDYYYTNGDAFKVLKTHWEENQVIDSVEYETTQGKFTLYISTIKSGCDISDGLIDKIQKVLNITKGETEEVIKMINVNYGLSNKYCHKNLTEAVNVTVPNCESAFAILNQLVNVQDFKTDCEFISNGEISADYYPANDASDDWHNTVIFFEYNGSGEYAITVINNNTKFTCNIRTGGVASGEIENLTDNDAAEIKAKLANF